MNASAQKALESIAIGAILTCILTWASRSFGLTWDETSYFKFSDSIRDWFLNHRSFDPEIIAAYWGYSGYHNPHPPFLKIVNAFLSPLFTGLIGFPAGYRVANILYISGCAALTWRLLRSSFSGPTTLAAIGFICLQPRVFGHLMVAATDSPIAMSWLALTLIAWRLNRTPVTAHRPVLRMLLFAVLAVAGATKITGFMAVIPLAVYFLIQKNFRECWWLVRASLFALFFVVLVSPDQWAHPLTAIGHYLTYPFLRTREAVSSFYLGRIYTFYLPWHYFPVMTAVTYPVILFVLLSGWIYIRKVENNGLLSAVLIPFGFWLVIAHLPTTPRHDGIRQFLTVYPLLGLLSWFGLLGWQWRLRQANRLPARRLLQIIFIPVILMILAYGTIRCHPFELSYYNALIGGIKGAEKKGLEMSYYLEAIHPDFIRRLNPYLDNGKSIYIMPPWRLLLEQYSRHGLLTGDYSISKIGAGVRPDYLLILRRRGYVDDELYKSVKPLMEVTWRGVSLVRFCESNPVNRGTRDGT